MGPSGGKKEEEEEEEEKGEEGRRKKNKIKKTEKQSLTLVVKKPANVITSFEEHASVGIERSRLLRREVTGGVLRPIVEGETVHSPAVPSSRFSAG